MSDDAMDDKQQYSLGIVGVLMGHTPCRVDVATVTTTSWSEGACEAREPACPRRWTSEPPSAHQHSWNTLGPTHVQAAFCPVFRHTHQARSEPD